MNICSRNTLIRFLGSRVLIGQVIFAKIAGSATLQRSRPVAVFQKGFRPLIHAHGIGVYGEMVILASGTFKLSILNQVHGRGSLS